MANIGITPWTILTCHTNRTQSWLHTKWTLSIFLKGICLITIIFFVWVNTMEILTKYSTTICHYCWFITAYSFPKKRSWTSRHSCVRTGITKIFLFCCVSITGISVKITSPLISIIYSVIESFINTIPSHILEEGKSEARKGLLSSKFCSSHDLIIHSKTFPMRSWVTWSFFVL